MTCPKCGGSMRTFDRLGIHVEQCDACKGIFLDKGELEQIVAAEERYNAAPPPPLEYGGPQQPPPPQYRDRPDSPSPHYRRRPDSPSPYGYGRGGYSDSPRPYGKRRRRSIFDQLFD